MKITKYALLAHIAVVFLTLAIIFLVVSGVGVLFNIELITSIPEVRIIQFSGLFALIGMIIIPIAFIVFNKEYNERLKQKGEDDAKRN